MLALDSIRRYIESLAWLESGFLRTDLLGVLDWLGDIKDAKALVLEWRRAYAICRFWKVRCEAHRNALNVQISQSAVNNEATCKRNLNSKVATIRFSTIAAELSTLPSHSQLLSAKAAYEEVIGVLEGLVESLNPSLIVQEAVATRRQDETDSSS